MSTLNVANVTDGTTTVGTSFVVNGCAKAYVFFDGTAGTIAPSDGGSQNVSSLTDDGTGNYQINFTNSMQSNANYAIFALSNAYHTADGGKVAANANMNTFGSGHSLEDAARCSFQTIGDLA